MIQLLFCVHSLASEIRWRKETRAIVDEQAIDCAFSGGKEYCKPAFVDIDGDNDKDLLVGDKDGKIRFFRNDGTPSNPRWSFVSDFFDSTIKERSSPTFVDMDADGDQDMFVGNKEGKICFFRNDGNAHSPLWIWVTDFYDSIDVGSESVPVFVDIDADSDFDLFVGKEDGFMNFYRNMGTKKTPIWNLVSQTYDSIDVGACSVPGFADLDRDGDLDLFIGEEEGNVNFYRNIGNVTTPVWKLVSGNYNSINVGRRSAPAFVDLDSDSDLDLFIGEEEGKMFFFQNDGTLYLPSWSLITENYLYLDWGAYSKPALADMDGNGVLDLFVGEFDGNINFYRSDGTTPISSWSFITENYFAIEAGDHSAPTFADINGDGNLDLLIGKKDGTIDFYENIGSSDSAFWVFVTDQYGLINVSGFASPAFVDVDGDSDLDLFIGQKFGKIYFYRNDGQPSAPAWTLVSNNFNTIEVGWYSAPTFGDLDLDGDFDLLIGNGEGKIWYYRNEGDSHNYSFTLDTCYYDSIDVGDRSTPILCDFDSDGDEDLFIGESQGGLHYYKNLTLNSIKGKVTDGTSAPLVNAAVYLSGDKKDTTFTDSSGNYKFIGLPLGNYCVFRNQALFQYCFFPLNSDTFEINFVGATQVDEFTEQNILDYFQLFPNYPNPFNPLTNICYFLPVDGEVKLNIYNLRGEKVKKLVNGFQTRGEKKMVWDGKDTQGKEVTSGIYFCKLQANQGCKTIRIVLLK